VAALVTGGAWGLIPAILKVKFRTNEIVSTLLFNFIAMYLVIYAVRVPLLQPGAVTPQSANLPKLFSIPILVATIVVVVVISYVLIERTRLGYEIQVVGRSPKTAAYAGINIAYAGVVTMVIGGALAGLGGAVIVTSRLVGTLMPGLTSNLGFVGIGVALMARLRSAEVPLSAFILGLLFVTIRFLSISIPTIPLLFTTAVVGIIMIAVAIVRRE
jgi:simple sugar transport system permease protein